MHNLNSDYNENFEDNWIPVSRIQGLTLFYFVFGSRHLPKEGKWVSLEGFFLTSKTVGARMIELQLQKQVLTENLKNKVREKDPPALCFD